MSNLSRGHMGQTLTIPWEMTVVSPYIINIALIRFQDTAHHQFFDLHGKSNSNYFDEDWF
jgi:hypothetical protein